VGTTSRLAQSDGSNGYVVLSTGGIVFRVLCVRSDGVSRPVLVASALGSEEIGIVGVKGLGCRGAGNCSDVVYTIIRLGGVLNVWRVWWQRALVSAGWRSVVVLFVWVRVRM
jgi:hypothetical protein